MMNEKKRGERTSLPEQKNPLLNKEFLEYLKSELVKYPETHEGIDASLRTVINLLLVFIDTIPGIGEASSGLVDTLKAFAILRGMTMKHGERTLLNTTPDVPFVYNIVSEIFEPCFGFIFPSHAIPSALQFKKDLPRIQAFLKLSAQRIADYQQSKQQRDREKAADVFLE